LDKAEALVESKKLTEARDLLESLDRRYPRQPDVLYPLMNVYYDLKDVGGYRWAAEHLAQVVSDDPDVDIGLAGGYLTNTQLAKALGAFRRFVAKWPDDPRVKNARETIEQLEEALKDQLDLIGIPGDQGLEILTMNEDSLSFMARGEYAQARKVAERLLERKPDFLPALNNVSQVYGLEGRFEQAISTAGQVLASDPDNVHALSNMVRFLCMSGRAGEAGEWAVRLKATRSQAIDVWTKKAEGLSYLGDDEGVLEVLKSAQRDPDQKGVPMNPLVYHLAAVAAMRLGKERDAHRYWREALKVAPGFELARSNLEDLLKPAGERHAPWPFSIAYWIPAKTIEDLRATIPAGEKVSNEVAERAFRRFARKHPELEGLVPALLDRGDLAGRDFAFRLAKLTGTPSMLQALRDFAVSTRGPDAMRLEAANVAGDAGLFPGGLARLWSHGKTGAGAWHDVMLMSFEITDEPDYELTGRAHDLMEEAIAALHRGEGEKAEQLLEETLQLEPDTPGTPSILNNLALAYEQQGRSEEAHALVANLHEEHPDYLFARVALAKLRIWEGKPKMAKELLDPLMSRKRFHHTEFGALCDAYIDMHVAMRNREAARSWLDLWAGYDPDNPAVQRWQQRLGGTRRQKAVGSRQCRQSLAALSA
jgi:tetratricopeptide (TPR) repeat protein